MRGTAAIHAQGRRPLAEAAIFGAKKGGAANSENVMTIRTVYPHRTFEIRFGPDEPVMKLLIAYVPQDTEQRTIRIFGTISRLAIPGMV